MSAVDVAKRIDVRHNVSIRVLDSNTHKVISEHTGHNASTNSMLTGIGHYLLGEGVLNQGAILSKWVPQYISLGTMGLINQDADENGLPKGIGVTSYVGVSGLELTDEQRELIGISDMSQDELKYHIITEGSEADEILRFVDYIKQTPGFGADGYDSNQNNGRLYLGLGPEFAKRQQSDITTTWIRGDINQDGEVTNDDLMILLKVLAGTYKGELSDEQWLIADVNNDGKIDSADAKKLQDYLDGYITVDDLGTVEYTEAGPTVNCELISNSYKRSEITYRDIIPETESEQPKTIDIVFSAYVSTGALSQFRDKNGYVYITEAGLWSTPTWSDGGDNGLLAGYRIAPPDSYNWDMTSPENRDILKRNIIRVGINQVVQVVWKIQLGGIDQLGGIQQFYPTYDKLRWSKL